jgi:hypothetical protein
MALVGTKKLSCTVSEVLSEGNLPALWGCLSVLPELFGVWFGISATTRRNSRGGLDRLASIAL